MMRFYGWNFATPHLALGGGLFGLFFWGLLIFLFILLLAAIFSGGGGKEETREEKGNRALDILKERYAKGEIDKEEFEEKKKDLS